MGDIKHPGIAMYLKDAQDYLDGFDQKVERAGNDVNVAYHMVQSLKGDKPDTNEMLLKSVQGLFEMTMTLRTVAQSLTYAVQEMLREMPSPGDRATGKFRL